MVLVKAKLKACGMNINKRLIKRMLDSRDRIEKKQLLGRTKRARRNLALKLVLENRFKPELRKYFNTITKEFRTFYTATGRIISPESFSGDTQALLKKHYLRVSRAFNDEMQLSFTDQKKYLKKQNEEEEQAKIDAALLLFINQVTPERSNIIDETTMKDINKSVLEAQAQLVTEEKETTNVAVAALSALLMSQKFQARETTINSTETQYMSESTKLIEASVIGSDGQINLENILAGVGLAAIVGTKSWASILDDKTRTGEFNHVLADGQTVKTVSPFVVSGERLLYPSDRSLNASLSNVINCRCSALYNL
jgi:hypothetical protein